MKFRALQIPAFRKLWIGQAVSQFGDSLYFLIFLFMVDRVTKNPALVGAVAAIQAVPYLFLSAWAGALADRMDRRVLMVASDVSSAIILFLFAGLIMLLGFPPMWVIFVTAALLATCNVFFAPAKSASIPRLVPPDQLQEANALSATTQNLMPLIGLGLGATVLGAVEAAAPTAFFLIAVLTNALSFCYSGWCLAQLPSLTPPPSEEEPKHVLLDALEGARFIRSNPAILTMVFSFVGTTFFIAPFMVVYLAVNREWFGGAYWTLATFEASFVAAMVIMSLALTKIRVTRVGRSFVLALLPVSLLVLLMGFAPQFWPFLILNLLCGFVVPFLNIPIQTYLQRTVPDGYMGRVGSVMAMASTVVVPISNTIAGATLGVIGAQAMFIVMGIGMGLVGLACFAVPAFRRATIPTDGEEVPPAVSNAGSR